uniref:Uncharacterized protein n=1 Tax=Ciona savignyi TaxID=51511 RepID=H2Z3G9_CIOSA
MSEEFTDDGSSLSDEYFSTSESNPTQTNTENSQNTKSSIDNIDTLDLLAALDNPVRSEHTPKINKKQQGGENVDGTVQNANESQNTSTTSETDFDIMNLDLDNLELYANTHIHVNTNCKDSNNKDKVSSELPQNQASKKQEYQRNISSKKHGAENLNNSKGQTKTLESEKMAKNKTPAKAASNSQNICPDATASKHTTAKTQIFNKPSSYPTRNRQTR